MFWQDIIVFFKSGFVNFCHTVRCRLKKSEIFVIIFQNYATGFIDA